MKTRFLALLLALSPLTAQAYPVRDKAQAGDTRPTFSVGVGVESSTSAFRPRALISATFSINRLSSAPQFGDSTLEQAYTQFFVVEAQVGLGKVAGSNQALSYADFKFTPVAHVFADNSRADGYTTTMGREVVKLKALPTEVSRELPIGKSLDVTVSAVGFEVQKADTLFFDSNNSNAAVWLGGFVQASVDALGFRYLSSLEDKLSPRGQEFLGGHIAKASLMLGPDLQIKQDFFVRLAVGGTVDVGMGNLSSGNGSSVSGIVSEQNLFGRISFIAPKIWSRYQDIEAYVQVGVKHLSILDSDQEMRQTNEDRLPLYVTIGASGGF